MSVNVCAEADLEVDILQMVALMLIPEELHVIAGNFHTHTYDHLTVQFKYNKQFR